MNELVKALRADADFTKHCVSVATKKIGQDCLHAADELEAQTALIAELVEALKPFAEAAAAYDPEEDDDSALAWNSQFVFRELRDARSALSKANLATTAEKRV